MPCDNDDDDDDDGRIALPIMPLMYVRLKTDGYRQLSLTIVAKTYVNEK